MTEPTTEAGRALLKGHSIECHTPDGHHRILSDTEGRKVVLAIETEARAAGRKEERERSHRVAVSMREVIAIERNGKHDGIPFGWLNTIDQWAAILDAPRATAVAADRVDDAPGASQPAEEES